MEQMDKIQKELIEKIYSELTRAMNGPNGEILKGGSEEYLNGLIKAYRIVQSFDPHPEPKTDTFLKKRA